MRRLVAIRWLWPGFSALFIGIGAGLALQYFPGAGFGKHPTGLYDAELVGFAACVSVPMAVAQFGLLLCIVRDPLAARSFWLWLWVPLTSAALMAMILPLWSFDAQVFMLMPVMVLLPMLPGALLLGFVQWFAAYWLIGMRMYWIMLTVVGAIIGSVVGLIVAFMLQPLSMEVTWAVLTGAGIAIPQGWLLSEAMETFAS
jgi:hypothetical protein